MSEESTTPDLAELSRQAFEATNRRDLDAVTSFCPSDGVYDTSHIGLGMYEGGNGDPPCRNERPPALAEGHARLLVSEAD